jgi:hypothetical protein
MPRGVRTPLVPSPGGAYGPPTRKQGVSFVSWEVGLLGSVTLFPRRSFRSWGFRRALVGV